MKGNHTRTHDENGQGRRLVAMGPEVLDELMQTEVTELAGPKGKHDPDRTHDRHGTED